VYIIIFATDQKQNDFDHVKNNFSLIDFIPTYISPFDPIKPVKNNIEA